MRTELTSHYNLFGDMQIRWYNADDVDNLLDKKDVEIEKLDAIGKRNQIAAQTLRKKMTHQKYKQCLATAEWCDAEADVADADGDYEDMRWYQKWHQRWQELAKKFKEAK